MKKQHIIISETTGGGSWVNSRTGRKHKTAAHALKAVNAAAQRDAVAQNEGIITTIEWEPCTPVGRLVVRAILASTEPQR